MGTLYVVSTPIGNLGDMTYRAALILSECDIIVCEDTRQIKKILSHYSIDTKKLLVVNEHNEQQSVYQAIEELSKGSDIAVVSDAGTPGVSDPGYLLVSQCIAHGAKVISVPGASAVLAALVSSGLPAHDFRFVGFLSKKKVARERFFREIKNADYGGTVIFFESPIRLASTLAIMDEVLGDVAVVVARELTKKHEEVYRGTPTSALRHFRATRGEVTILFHLQYQWPALRES